MDLFTTLLKNDFIEMKQKQFKYNTLNQNNPSQFLLQLWKQSIRKTDHWSYVFSLV